MSILKKLQSIAAHKGFLTKLLFDNWKPKLICLILAIILWEWVESRYVKDSKEWDLNDIRLSVPEFNN